MERKPVEPADRAPEVAEAPPAGAREAPETYGVVEVRRMVKEDGRELLVFTRRADQ